MKLGEGGIGPMPSEWYVSFHGGDEKDSLNNIHVYSSDGHEVRKALNTKSLAAGVTLRELRGFVFGPDRNLYVVNAYYEYSEVLKFKRALNKDGQHDFLGVFTKRDAASNPGLSHPFNAVFDSEGDLYVSSQDTGVISRYHGPMSKLGNPGTPMPLPSFIKDSNVMPPGTFVPSKNLSSKGVLVIREAIFGLDGNLYVADREADCVRKYQGCSGIYLGKLVLQGDGLDKPIHLLFSSDGRYLFVGNGGNDSILLHDTARNSTNIYVASKAGGLNGPAGMAFGDDGRFYVASRNSREILRYDDINGTRHGQLFIKNLKDNPEFLMLVRH
jgi:DNA-binding beta-propeller fold protein YncE